eukprot:5777275-Alexandrium_andersonii.AAC.1
MSASLVGSEMCIRDSLSPSRPPSHAFALKARSMLHARLAHMVPRVRAMFVRRCAHGPPQAQQDLRAH